MREILFRGKRLSDGGWSEGNLAVKKCGVAIITPDDTPLGRYGQVDPATVGQYTGLTDKHGKRIFEGDVVAFDNGHFAVQYITCRMGFGFSGLKGRGVISGFTMMDWEHLEVIGNIHDNPELIKEE